MNKEEIIEMIKKSLDELKNDKNIEITDFSSEPEINRWEMVDGTGFEYLSYHYTIELKQPRRYKIVGGIRQYENNNN